MKKRSGLSTQKGFSLVEIMLAIAIIMVMAIAIFIAVVKALESNKANTETQNLTTIIVGVRNMYGGRYVYSALDTANLNRAHIFPSTMNGGNYSLTQPIRHIEGGDVEVIPWGADVKRFAVVYHDMPQYLCNKMALNYSRNVEQVMVGATLVKDESDVASDVGSTLNACENAPVDVFFIQR